MNLKSRWFRCAFRYLTVFTIMMQWNFTLPLLAQSKPEAVNLQIDYKTNPIGIDGCKPRFFWEIRTNDRNVVQTAYQIRAAFSEKDFNSPDQLVWDTRKVKSDQSIQVDYNGPELKSGQRIYWQVKVWDNKGRVSPWSEITYWETGLLNPSDWKATWIEPDLQENETQPYPCPFLRKEFKLKGKVKSARIYATCHGLYQINLNGEKVGDQLFTPGWTSYHKRLQYQVYDVTAQLNRGSNAIGVILGDGWYRGPLVWQGEKNLYGKKAALLFQLKVTYEDGSEEVIVSDHSWKSSTGPILKSEIYNGETYDARLEQKGWDKAGFNDKNWNGCNEKNYDNSILVASKGVPVRVTEVLKPVKKIITPKGEVVFDFGQNMVGWVHFKLKGEAGSKITIHHAEVLDQEGNFYTDNLREAKQQIQYTFKGKGFEEFEPHFTFQGFRYIRISDYPGEVSMNDFSGK